MLLRQGKETDDMLRLLAVAARVRDYEPPSAELGAMLDELGGAAKDPVLRRAQVTAFLLATGAG